MKINYSNPQSAIRNPQSAIRNPQSAIRNPQSAIRNSYKLTAFFFIAFFISSIAASSQTTAIPDDKFEQALIDLGIDTNGKNNTILNSDAVAVDSLNILARGIADLSGIEAFTSLTYLNSLANQLTSVDVSSNTKLTYLDCSNNQLTSLNVSKNIALTTLHCEVNELTSLNISANINLRELFCRRNKLLSCIQVDDASNIPSLWTKDATAVYSEDCSALSNKEFKLAEVSILPNPTRGVLNITALEKADYRLLNIKGQILKKGVLVSGESKINVSSFVKGIYLLNVKTSKGSFTKKVVRD